MASYSSSRDLARAIQSALTTPRLPLPNDLIAAVESFLDQPVDSDQASADRLHDDLLSAYQKSVSNQQPIHYAMFLAVLCRLRPVIRSPTHVVEWWDKVVEPVLDYLSQEHGTAPDILASAADFLAPETETQNGDDAADQDTTDNSRDLVAIRLLQKWIAVCHSVQMEGRTEAWLRKKPIQNTLLVYAKRKPVSFFSVLNDFFVQRDHRLSSTVLLSEFIRSEPPHLHLIIKSPLFDSLLRCLQSDTSTTAVSLALTSLIMLLPNMPGSIVPFLPTLFNIYARLLFWDHEPLSDDEGGRRRSSVEQFTSNPLWEKCSFSPKIDGSSIPQLEMYFTVLYGLYPLNFMDYIRKPQRYLRHANAMDADDVEVQPSHIRDRSQKYQQCHLLHPNFYSLTIESEKTDFSRWMRCATADVAAGCVALHVDTDHCLTHQDTNLGISLPGVAMVTGTPAHVNGGAFCNSAPEPGVEGALLSASLDSSMLARDGRLSVSTSGATPSASSRALSANMRRSSQSNYPSENPAQDTSYDSPTLPATLPQSASRTDLQGLVETNKGIRNGLQQNLDNDSVPSLSLSHLESGPARSISQTISSGNQLHLSSLTSAMHSDARNPDSADQLADMRRQILLLKNDLSFERYMIQQHLAHIGWLRRSNVRQTVSEAETQNLIMANRTLKHRVEEAKKSEAQIKKEAEMSRNRSKNWEDSLSTKLRALREAQKKWTEEESTLRRDLKIAQSESQRLLLLVCEKEVAELKVQQDMEMLEESAAEMNKLKDEVQRLSVLDQENKKIEKQLKLVQEQAAISERKLELACMRLEARELELGKTREYYENQSTELNLKLAELLPNGQKSRYAGNLADTRHLVESALAASRAKHLELQKNHTKLVRKYTVLQAKTMERATIYDDVTATGLRSDKASVISDPDTEGSGMFAGQSNGGGGGGSSVGSTGSGGYSMRHRPRMASDAGSPEAVSPTYWNGPVSNSLGSVLNTLPGQSSVLRRPSTPSGAVLGSSSRGDMAGMSGMAGITGVAGMQGTAGNTSPQADRVFGRGGIQNSSFKERKDKKRDEKDKKERKSSGGGIRGMRGFV